MTKQYDICIIGGGINGCGIACDAAGRGLSVLLCEQNDLASGTSSRSSKLIHGGLRYLENYQFRLVREALKEREILINKAPHLIRELRFVLPHEKHLRPKWLLRAGLFLYDHLAKRRKIKGSRSVNLQKTIYGEKLDHHLKTGFIYSDCQADDARLVLANAIAARNFGAEILTHTQCVKVTAMNDYWQVTLRDAKKTKIIHARTLINASGPWINNTISNIIGLDSRYHSQLVKGSHIIVPRFYPGEHAYILQNTDKRIIFTIPYQNNLTLIGTTDESFSGDPSTVAISTDEINYLCKVVNHYFNTNIDHKQIVSHYAGVRPLYGESGDTLSQISRDYILELQQQSHPAVINIFGGKLTTYRRLSEQALSLLKPIFPNMKPNWTDRCPLPGGDIPTSNSDYLKQLQSQYPWLPATQLTRYFYQYGSETKALLGNCQNISDLGQNFGFDLYELEVIYLIKQEWATTAEDILWRRTKVGLQFNQQQKQQLQNYLDSHC